MKNIEETELKPTLCRLAQDIIDHYDDRERVIADAKHICECGEAMEARLHAYCDSIERLGFVRKHRTEVD